VLQEVLVQRVGDLQPANECECRDILTIVMYFGQLILEEANVHLETDGWSHMDGEEVVLLLLELPSEGVLGEEQLGKTLEIMDRAWRKRVKPI